MNETATGFIKLGIGIVILWAMVFHVCPAVIEMIPPYKLYADTAERLGIHTGALFYTNVAESTEAEFYVRNSLRFPTRSAPGQ
jgi:hypothetical protein